MSKTTRMKLRQTVPRVTFLTEWSEPCVRFPQFSCKSMETRRNSRLERGAMSQFLPRATRL